VYSRYHGNVTGEDMRRHIEEVCKDDRFEQHRYNILDFSDATDFNSLGVSPYEAKIFPTVAEARKWIEESGFASRRYSVT